MGNLHLEELQALKLEARMRLEQLQYPHLEEDPLDLQGLLHELQVHKIELEMQNEELQKANLGLELSTQRYKNLYELAPIGYVSISDQGFITDCNSKALSLFGIKHNKLNQYRFAQFVDDKEKNIWQNIFLNIKNNAEEEILSFDILLVNNLGVSFSAYVNCLLARGEAETYVLRLAIVDITERKLTAKKLKDDEEIHQALVNTSMEGFWITDKDGHFLEVNETYCQMSGYSQSELLTMKISDIEANESTDAVLVHINNVISKGQDRFESKHRRRDGSVFEVRVNAQYMYAEGGRLVVFLQDLSSIKAITEKIDSLQHEQKILEGTTQQLQVALDADRNLSVAVGIVMGQQQVGKDGAMKLLRKRARDQNLKLNELAAILVNAREALNFEIKQ